MIFFHFFFQLDDLQEAIKVRERKRNVVPPVYNQARLSEVPLPVLVLTPDESDSNDDSDEIDPLDASANASVGDGGRESDDNASFLLTSSELGESTAQTESVDEMNNSNTNNMSSLFLSAVIESSAVLCDDVNNTNMASPVLAAAIESSVVVNDDASGSQALTATNKAESCNAPVNIIQIKQEPVFSPLNDEDDGAIGSIFDDSFEKLNDSDDDILIRRCDIIPQPKRENMIPYTVKVDDIISGNMPFATNVSVFYC